MSYCRTDDSFDTHPKVLKLGTDERRWTWLRVLLYTTRYGTPEVPSAIKETIPKATPKFLADCITFGLLDVATDGTMRVHNWDDYNGVIAERREQWKTNKRTQRGQRQGQNGDRSETSIGLAGAQPPASPFPSLREESSSLSSTTARDADEEATRQRAWQERAAAPDVRSPSAFVRSGMASGAWPDPAPADARPVNMPPSDPGAQIAALIRNGVIGERFELDDEIQRAGLDASAAGSLVAQFDLARKLDETKEEE